MLRKGGFECQCDSEEDEQNKVKVLLSGFRYVAGCNLCPSRLGDFVSTRPHRPDLVERKSDYRNIRLEARRLRKLADTWAPSIHFSEETSTA